MLVLIVATTRMGGRICVGGLDLESNESLRLLQADGDGFAPGTFEVGQVHRIDGVRRAQCRPPHVEDLLVRRREPVGVPRHAMRDLLLERVEPWRGAPDVLFDGSLRWTGRGSGYVDEDHVPPASTGYWISDSPLELEEGYYVHEQAGRPTRRLRFVGCADPVPVLLAGRLLRVSLARWWAPEDFGEERCYLQLSGWYA